MLHRILIGAVVVAVAGTAVATPWPVSSGSPEAPAAVGCPLT